MRKIVCLLVLCFVITLIYAQNDSVSNIALPMANAGNDTLSVSTSAIQTNSKDTSAKEKKIRTHSPKVAAWLSTAIPGLGQVYNRKYWKVPIVYAGLGVSAFLVYYYHKEYVYYRTEYRLRVSPSLDLVNANVVNKPNPKLASLPTENVYAYENSNRRNMEISIIALSVFYILNIVDAAVDAHLMDFDISNDLTMQIIPYGRSNNTPYYSFSATTPNLGLTLQLNFK
ncbi:MAG: hypothetical protein KBA86_00800 [Bacteroidales bacterium]|nr:hypothetical protein [Bacteroidales bacterium]